MRLPKFRCKNKIGNWCFFTVLHNGNVNEENFYLETLSQFTGLLDKQGVEIYEGDIVKEPYYVDENNGFLLLEVVFNNGSFLGKVINRDGFGLQNLTMYKEVIGNIYENPELLS